MTAMLISACGANPPSASRDQHVVRRGETLYTIAFRYDRDYRDLARWNRLGDGSLIYPGQVIRLTPPSRVASTPAPSVSAPLPSMPEQPPPAWRWPTAGSVEVGFGSRPGSGTGILIAGRAGQPVRAAAAGHVVYSGGGLIGYGQLIIIQHNDTYLSAYGHNSALFVREGDSVKQGQRIATMGEGPGRQPRLHFEIRKNGKPVDPRAQLPDR